MYYNPIHSRYRSKLGIWIWAILLIGCSILQSQSNKYQLLQPHQISYDGVPGFDEKSDYSILEWSEISAHNPDEPQVAASIEPPAGLRIRWLGTAGYEISDDSTTILIDPFVSRPSNLHILMRIEIDTEAVNHYILSPIKRESLKTILISHNHYDHVQDVPYILAQHPNPDERPIVVGDPNVDTLIKSYKSDIGIQWLDTARGLEKTHTIVLDLSEDKTWSEVGQFGNFTIQAYLLVHPKYDFLPWRGPVGTMRGSPPYLITDYKSYENISIGYLVEYRTLRIFFSDSHIVKYPEEIGPVDILILTIAAREGKDTIADDLAAMRPKYVIPSHYDNFFQPIHESKHFDFTIGLPVEIQGVPKEFHLVDFSRFRDFLSDFEGLYVSAANERLGPDGLTIHPRLRLMKLLYYYSLEHLLDSTSQP